MQIGPLDKIRNTFSLNSILFYFGLTACLVTFMSCFLQKAKLKPNLTSKYWGCIEPDKSLIYSSTFLIETLTDQTSFGAGQPWIWREHEELSRHLHKLFILPYFTAIWDPIFVTQTVQRYNAFLTVHQNLLWSRCLNPVHKTWHLF